MLFVPVNPNKYIKKKKYEKIYKLGTADLYLDKEIKTITEDIEKLIISNFSQKTKENIINFFKKENNTDKGLKSRKSLIEKMEKDYTNKSLKQLKFFINNIAFKYNTFLDKPLINWGKSISFYNQLKKNYTVKIDNENNIYQELEEEKIKGEFLSDLDKKYAIKKISKIYCLEEYLKEDNVEMAKLFITFTNPTQYHYYTLKDKKEIDINAIDGEQFGSKRFIKNPKYNEELGSFENSINEGMKKQKEINRYFHIDLERRIRRAGYDINLYHFTIYEPHKSLQPHSHKMLIIPKEIEELAYKSFKLTKKHFNLKQVKIEEIKHKASTYITKYLIKTLNLDNNIDLNISDSELINSNDFCEEEARLELIAQRKNKSFLSDNFFNIYRRYFGAKNRIFTSSNFKYTTQKKIDIMYKYLKENYPSFLENLKKTGISLYYQLEQLEQQGIFTFEKGNKIAYSFNTELLKEEYNKYFKEEKKNLYKLIKQELKIIKKKNDNDKYTYKNKKKKYIDLTKEEQKKYRELILKDRLNKYHNFNINREIPLSKEYLINKCKLQARERILTEIKQDHYLLKETEENINIEFKEEETQDYKKRILETVEKTKYIKVRNEKNIKSASFNKSFNLETKESSETIEIYKEDMYKDYKGSFVDLEVLHLVNLPF